MKNIETTLKSINNVKDVKRAMAKVIKVAQEMGANDYLEDFYAYDEALEVAQNEKQNVLKVRMLGSLEEIKNGYVFQKMTLDFEAVNIEKVKDLANELLDLYNEKIVAGEKFESGKNCSGEKFESGKKSNQEKIEKSNQEKIEKETGKNLDDEKLTHSSTYNTVDEVIEKIMNELKELDKEDGIVDFMNYALYTTTDLLELFGSKLIELHAKYINENDMEIKKVRIGGYINERGLNEITDEMIKEAAKIGYEDLKETHEELMKKIQIKETKERLEQGEAQWNMEDVKVIIKELDEKTGLNGQDIPLKLSSAKRKKAHFKYNSVKPVEFAFTKDLLRYATYGELRDVVIHEYGHYWQYVLTGKTGHNKEFSKLCQELGGSGDYYFNGFSLLGER